jgi:plasmid stabilization system protein ParE
MGRSGSAPSRPVGQVKLKRLRIQSQAQEEINKAFDWYFQRSPEAAASFLMEVGACLEQIVSPPPQLYSRYTKNTRKSLLSGFPYSAIY